MANEEGELVWVNRKLSTMLGYLEQGLIQLKLLDRNLEGFTSYGTKGKKVQG